MSLDPKDWRLLRNRESGAVELVATDAATEAREIMVTIPRTEDSPSLGLMLEELVSSGDMGIVAVGGLVEGGNGEKATAPILPGDALVDANGVALEGLTYDMVLEALGSLDPTAGVRLTVKRLQRLPRAKVSLRFPESEGRADETITLFKGANLRRAMLSSGVKLNDPLARRFDAGVGTGDCGGEGTCCTCVVDVMQGGEVLNAQDAQERQILKRFPRWRLACKASVAELSEDTEVVMRVTPRNFDGFYGKDEVDVDGNPLERDTKRTA